MKYSEEERSAALRTGLVVPDPMRCVQCGVCAYNCPLGLDIRAYSWNGKPVTDSRCILCGECVARCPRSALRIERVLPP